MLSCLYFVYYVALWTSAMHGLCSTGCGLFSVWRRQRTSISSQIPCDRPTWQRAQLCRGGCISSHISCRSFPFFFFFSSTLLPVSHSHFIPYTLSLFPPASIMGINSEAFQQCNTTFCRTYWSNLVLDGKFSSPSCFISGNRFYV